VVGWALRWLLLCCGIALIGIWMLDRGAAVPPSRTTESSSSQRSVTPTPNTIVYSADDRGHVVLDAAVNGTPVKMLVDTGASLVTLTSADARAAGISPGELTYSRRVSTANGIARMAPVTIREIRIDQLSLFNVPAAVVENLNISLLGMSFLNHVQGYEMRDGRLMISW
jgi:aspartyl protease family protein